MTKTKTKIFENPLQTPSISLREVPKNSSFSVVVWVSKSVDFYSLRRKIFDGGPLYFTWTIKDCLHTSTYISNFHKSKRSSITRLCVQAVDTLQKRSCARTQLFVHSLKKHVLTSVLSPNSEDIYLVKWASSQSHAQWLNLSNQRIVRKMRSDTWLFLAR